MTDADLLIILVVLSLHDGLRLGAQRLFYNILQNGPELLWNGLVFLVRSPLLLPDFYRAVVGYFQSPIFKRRADKFRSLKRGYYSFLMITGLYVLSFFLPLLVTDVAWYVRYEGQSYFPVVRSFAGYYLGNVINFKSSYFESDFGLEGDAPVKYRSLKRNFEEQKSNNKVVLAPYPYSPNESNLDEYEARPPHKPDRTHWFGTDDRGRDVFARMLYGFQISMTFALIVTFLSYLIGVSVGGYLGYYGGMFDIVVQRIVEIWSAIPFLFAVMIVVSIVKTNHMMVLLIFLLAAFGWMGMTYYIRGEFLREKAKDYVAAAISIGVKDTTIIFRHILPNALTPVISFMPFAIVGNISALVSLDFLGFGLPVPTPSWGELLNQGREYLKSYWLVFAPLGGLFTTLMLVSFIGEAVREAFDPKQYSRLR